MSESDNSNIIDRMSTLVPFRQSLRKRQEYRLLMNPTDKDINALAAEGFEVERMDAAANQGGYGIHVAILMSREVSSE